MSWQHDAVGLPENAADHGNDVEDQLLAGSEVITEPEGSGSQIFVVVARFEVKPPVVSRYVRPPLRLDFKRLDSGR